MLLKKTKIKCLLLPKNSKQFWICCKESLWKCAWRKKYFNCDRCDKSYSKKSIPWYRIAAVQKNSDKAVFDRLYIIIIYKKKLEEIQNVTAIGVKTKSIRIETRIEAWKNRIETRNKQIENSNWNSNWTRKFQIKKEKKV